MDHDRLLNAWNTLWRIGFQPGPGYLRLMLLSKAGRPSFEYPPLADTEALWQKLWGFMIRNDTRNNLLAFGINTRCRPGGFDADVEQIHTVALDLDGSRGIGLEEQRSLLGRFLERCPSVATVESGRPGHLHVYWRFAEPQDPDTGRRLMDRLCGWLKADSSRAPSKMMRLPGSLNWKLDPPVVVTAHLDGPLLAVTPDTFDAAFVALFVALRRFLP